MSIPLVIDHFDGAEHVIPAHRPDPADVREKHLRGEGERLQGRGLVTSGPQATEARELTAAISEAQALFISQPKLAPWSRPEPSAKRAGRPRQD